MIPKLAAEEALASAGDIALGSGTLKKEDARAAQDALREQAGVRRHRASAAGLGALGFDVVKDS